MHVQTSTETPYLTDDTPQVRQNEWPEDLMIAAIEGAAIDSWVSGNAWSQQALSHHVATAIGRPWSEVVKHLPRFFAKLEERGSYVSQRAHFGSKVGGDGTQTSPFAFLLGGPPPDSANLRHIVEPFLVDPEVPADAKRSVRTALRYHFDLDVQCEEEVILRRCGSVQGTEIYHLPTRVFEAATSPPKPLGEQTAKNYRTAIRRAMRYAADRRLTPIIFPRHWALTAWEEAKESYFPLAASGPTHSAVSQFRRGWHMLGTALQKVEPSWDGSPGSVSRDLADRAINHMHSVDGRRLEGYLARGALRHLAKVHGKGPYAEPSSADEFMVATPLGPSPAIYLRGPNGEGADGDWEQFYDVLAHHGFPDSVKDFLQWYVQWVTLDPVDLLDDPARYPKRRSRLRLSHSTLPERILALRALLGAGIKALTHEGSKATFGLGLNPEAMTPARIFGHDLEKMARELIRWWRARAAVLPDGQPGKALNGALRQILIGGSMLALGHYERLLHRRNAEITVRSTPSGEEAVDRRKETVQPQTEDELASWRAYLALTGLADMLMSPDGRGSQKERTNAHRNIKRILEVTPPDWWINLLNLMVAKCRRLKLAKSGEGYAYHSLVLDTTLLGLLISTGCRIEELCHTRLDLQFDEQERQNREIRLRVVDRKNAKAHTVLVQPDFVPDDILAEYLTQSRPWFLAGKAAVAKTKGPRKSKKPARANAKSHEFLLISTSGAAYGSIEEARDGTGRNEVALKRRARQAGTRFRSRMIVHAREFQKLPKLSHYEFGPHTVRGSCAYGVYLATRSIAAAAHYLGDKESTVEEAYSALDGSHVDSSVLTGFKVMPRRRSSIRPPP